MPGDFLTRVEIEELVDRRFDQRLAKYEKDVIEPRHRETTEAQDEIKRNINKLFEKFRSLYRNGSGGPPGAVERLETSVAGIIRKLDNFQLLVISVLLTCVGTLVMEVIRYASGKH